MAGPTITITPATDHVVIRLRGAVVADSTRALMLTEGASSPVRYIPRDEIDMARLTPTATTSRCPWKGHCCYFAAADRPGDIAWSYEDPLPGVAAIRGHIAFYPGRTDPG